MKAGIATARTTWPNSCSRRAIALAPDGALIVADQVGSVVRAILPAEDGFGSGVPLVGIEVLPRVEGVRVTRFAGQQGATAGLVGDGGPATRAYFSSLRGIAIDQAGNVFVADVGNNAIRRISTNGTISTLAGGNGSGTLDGPGDQAQFRAPYRVAVDAEGTVFVSEVWNERVRRIAPDGTVSTLDGEAPGGSRPIAAQPDGSLLIARSGSILRRAPDGTISTVTRGSGTICALAVDHEGTIFFAVHQGNVAAVKKVILTGDVVTVFEGRAGRYGGPCRRASRGSRWRRMAPSISPTGASGGLFASTRAALPRSLPTTSNSAPLRTPGLRGSSSRPRGICLCPTGGST